MIAGKAHSSLIDQHSRRCEQVWTLFHGPTPRTPVQDCDRVVFQWHTVGVHDLE